MMTEMIHGPEGVKKHGHRAYVGGKWNEVAVVVFNFFVYGNRLRSDENFLDIGCGAFRCGRMLMNYLEFPGGYYGIEKEESLVTRGFFAELSSRQRQKLEQVIIADDFPFDQLHTKPNVSFAQSLFTHLPEDQIRLCLRKLGSWVIPESRFYATFVIGDARQNPKEPHDHKRFVYSIEQMKWFGTDHGWQANYIGEWGHPSPEMMMMEYVKT